MFNSYTDSSLRHSRELCDGCGACISVCPHAVFAREGRSVVVAQAASCMECGACQVNCPAGAIEVDSGVGCATAMMLAALFRRKEASCG
jgi:NAD-dependent dihydropyrimidine dehydrogenase PreA subunit